MLCNALSRLLASVVHALRMSVKEINRYQRSACIIVTKVHHHSGYFRCNRPSFPTQFLCGTSGHLLTSAPIGTDGNLTPERTGSFLPSLPEQCFDNNHFISHSYHGRMYMLFYGTKGFKWSELVSKGSFPTLFSVRLNYHMPSLSYSLRWHTYIHGDIMYKNVLQQPPSVPLWFHGVMVSTLDSESSDPSSNLGGT